MIIEKLKGHWAIEKGRTQDILLTHNGEVIISIQRGGLRSAVLLSRAPIEHVEALIQEWRKRHAEVKPCTSSGKRVVPQRCERVKS